MILDLNLAKARNGESVKKQLFLQLPDELLSERDYKFNSNCKIDLTYNYSVDYVLVEGEGSVSLTGMCYRCGEEVSKEITFEFNEKFLPVNSQVNIDLELENYAYFGSEINITKMIEDNLLLALPYQFLCKEDCKGLCSLCYKNLNYGRCNCSFNNENAFAF